MNSLLIVILYLLAASVLFLFGMILFVRNRRSPSGGAVAFSAWAVLSALWSGSIILSLLLPNQAQSLLWIKIAFIFAAGSYIAFWRFAEGYSGKAPRKRLWFEWSLVIAISLGLMTLVWSNDQHHLFWNAIQFTQQDGLLRPTFVPGKLFILWPAYITLINLIILHIFLRILRHSPDHLKASINLSVGIILPMTISLAAFNGLIPFSPFESYSLGLLFAALIYARVIFRFGLFDILPLNSDDLLNHLSDGIIVINIQGNIAKINPVACQLLEIDPSVKGKSILPYLQSLPIFRDMLQKSLGTNTRLKNELTLLTGEQKQYYDVQLTPLTLPDGRVSGHAISLRDITPYRQIEDALRKSEVNLDLVITSTNLGTWDFNWRTKVSTFNQQFADMLGYSLEEVSRIHAKRIGLIHPDDLLHVKQIFKEEEYSRDIHQVEYRLQKKDGCYLWVLDIGQIIQWDDDESPLRSIGIYLNISEKKEREEHISHLLYRNQFHLLQMEALRAINEEISSELHLPPLLNSILKKARNLLNASVGEIAFYNEATGNLDIVISEFEGIDVQPATTQKLGEGILGYVAQTRAPLIVENYGLWENRSPQYAGLNDYHAISVPLLAGDDLVGAISIGRSLSKKSFTEADVRLLGLFSVQATIAIRNARLFEQAKQRAAEAETLSEAGATVAESLRMEEAIQQILKQLERVIKHNSATVQILQDDYVEVIGERGLPQGKSLLGTRFYLSENAPSARVINQRQPVLSGDTSHDFEKVIYTQETKPFLGVPLIVQERVIGVLAIYNHVSNSFTTKQVHLVQAFANQVAIVIENARLFERVEKLAITDPLTGLLNRRYFFELFENEVERAKRYHLPFSILLMDIDHFKLVNDYHGHQVGDQVLQKTALKIKDCLREVDVLARYGGEEFIALLPNTDPEQALLSAERLRCVIENMLFETTTDTLKITLSLGVAGFDLAQSGSVDVLLAHADKALYQAKQLGRNQVVVSDTHNSGQTIPLG